MSTTTQRVTVTVQDSNDGGRIHGETVLAVEQSGAVLVAKPTDTLGQAHFHLGPGTYRMELSPPERGTSHRNHVQIPTQDEAELHVCIGIELR